ncbi:recombinase family protein [Streptomyces sp. NPDC020489]|uniref:recombinase family protein n=1 Tax=Streptomyces sp. NPDC020489 TaxID=3365077 RepID=UPI0037A9CC7D
MTPSYHFDEVHHFGRQPEVRPPPRRFTGRSPLLPTPGEEGWLRRGHDVNQCPFLHPICGTSWPSTPESCPAPAYFEVSEHVVHTRRGTRMSGWSRSFLNPSLVSALETGGTFEEWLGGRIPGVDYARISADQSTRSAVLAQGRAAGTGVRHQHEENRETADAFGVAVVKFYEDNGLTAVQPTILRPAFTEMTDALHCRRTTEGFPVQALIATEQERVWRLAPDFARVRQAVTVTEEGLFIERRAVFDLHSKRSAEDTVAGEGEVWRTKERVERHIRRRAIDGGTPGGRRRFGWLPPDPRSGIRINMRKDPEEWPVLREMIESALRGTSWNAIARHLNAQRVPTASGNRWSGATVRQALVNPVMCGYRAIHGALVRDPATGAPVVGRWDAPATVEEWEALVALSRQRGSKRGTRLTNGSPPPGGEPQSFRKYLFSGYVRCGAIRDDGTPCNSKMGGCARPTAADPDNAVYMCTALDCGGTARNVRDVDRCVEAVVLSLIDERRAAVGPEQPEWAGTPLLRSLIGKRDSLGPEQTADLQTRISGLETAREEHQRIRQESLTGWDSSRWPLMSLEQRRAATGTVLRWVTVLPLPPGRSRRAAFDPGLLRITPVS